MQTISPESMALVQMHLSNARALMAKALGGFEPCSLELRDTILSVDYVRDEIRGMTMFCHGCNYAVMVRSRRAKYSESIDQAVQELGFAVEATFKQ